MESKPDWWLSYEQEQPRDRLDAGGYAAMCRKVIALEERVLRLEAWRDGTDGELAQIASDGLQGA